MEQSYGAGDDGDYSTTHCDNDYFGGGSRIRNNTPLYLRATRRFVWYFVVRELPTDRFLQWAFEKRIDLTTREFVILASSYDRIQGIPISLKESFPIDDLELHYSIIRNDEYQQVGIYMRPSEAAKNSAAAYVFKVQGFIYIQNSIQLLYEKLTLPDDVVRVGTALSKKTGIKLIPKNINDLTIMNQ